MRAEAHQPEDNLVTEAQAGDERAFRALIDRHVGLVFTIGRARLRSREAAEDLTQEVFLCAWLRLAELRNPGQFTSWLSRIARNLATDWARRGQKVSRVLSMVPLDDSTPDVPDERQRDGREQMSATEEQSQVRRAIDSLPPDLAEVVLLHTAEGLSHSDIARHLGVRPSTVLRRWRRALAQMRDILEPALRDGAPALKHSAELARRTGAVIVAAGALSLSARAALVAALGKGALAGGALAAGAKAAIAILGVVVLSFGVAHLAGDGEASGPGSRESITAPAPATVLASPPQATSEAESEEAVVTDSPTAEVTLETNEPIAEPVGPHRLYGRTRWISGPNISGATIRVGQGGNWLATRTADAEGEFEFEGLPAGTFDIEAAAPGAEFQQARPLAYRPDDAASGEVYRSGPPLILEGHTGLVVTLVPTHFTFTGRAVGVISGAPQSHARLRLDSFEERMGEADTDIEPFVIETDENGRFQFEVPLEPMTGHMPTDISARLTPLDRPQERAHSVSLPNHRAHTELRDITLAEMVPVRGQVHYAVSGVPMTNVRLFVWSEDPEFGVETVTDSEGFFEVDRIPVLRNIMGGVLGDLHLEIRSQPWVWEGGASATTISARRFPGEMTQRYTALQLQVEDGAPLDVTVIDPNGRPIAGAEVLLEPWLRTGLENHYQLGTSDANGRLIASRPDPIPSTRVFAYTPEWPIIVSPPMEMGAHEVTAQAVPVTETTLRAVNAQGEPLPRATIRPYASRAHLLSMVDLGGAGPRSTGDFTVRVPAWHVSISAQTRESRASLGLDLRGQTISPEIVLQLGDPESFSIAGQVVDIHGQPIAGATVDYGRRREHRRELGSDGQYRTESVQVSLAHAETDRDGRFAMDVAARQFTASRLVADAEGYALASAPRTSSVDEDITIVLCPSIRLTGRLASQGGGPLPDRRRFILFTPSTRGDGWSNSGISNGRESTNGFWQVEASGSFTVDLPGLQREFSPESSRYPMPAWLMIQGGEDTAATSDFTLGDSPSQEIDLGTLTLRPTPPLTGRVVDTEGNPVAGARVSTARNWRTVTDIGGWFELIGLPEGEWRLGVHAEDHHQERLTVSHPSEEVVIELRSQRGDRSLQVRVIGPGGETASGLTLSGFTTVPNGSGHYFNAVTDQNGEASIQRLAGDSCYLRCYVPMSNAEMEISQTVSLTSEDPEFVFDLSQWREIPVLLRRDGASLANEQVSCSIAYTEDRTSGQAHMTTDGNGQLRILVTSGILTIQNNGAQESVRIRDEQKLEVAF